MKTHVAWLVSAAVLAGCLGSTCRAEATRVPAVRWSSGDHDIYQTCDRTPSSSISSEPLTETPDTAARDLEIDSRIDPVVVQLLEYVFRFGGLLIR
jgi:hypothetical protein